MDKSRHSPLQPLLFGILLIIFFGLVSQETACNGPGPNGPNQVKGPDSGHWFNWNVFFGVSTNAGVRGQIKADLEDSVQAYATRKYHGSSVLMHWNYCPCDSLLANLDATLVGVSTGGAPPPPTKPPIGPGGDYTVNDNQLQITIPEAIHRDTLDSTKKMAIGTAPPIPNGQIFAIIDTGLDTTAFKTPIRQFLWRDPSGTTLFNFLKPDGIGPLIDDNKVRHGTAVAILGMREVESAFKPKLLPLKAFDDSGRGTIYSVSCALSYAIKNHATIINASWGYYGDVDSVLYGYVKRANSQGIPIIAAAGNTKEPPDHYPPVCRDNLNTQNELRAGHLFYPACFSEKFPNLIAVDNLNKSQTLNRLIPCNYQNYAERFVSVGVLNRGRNCCEYHLEFLPNPIEGSSFATPIVTGKYLLRLQSPVPPTVHNAEDLIDLISSKVPTPPFYTRDGRYVLCKQQ